MRPVTARRVNGLGLCAHRTPEPIAPQGRISNNSYYVLTHCWTGAAFGSSVPLGSCNTDAVPRFNADRSLLNRRIGRNNRIELYQGPARSVAGITPVVFGSM